MSTDIHGVFQKYDGAQWIDVPSTYDFDRHYQLFAVLAGVRNGYGFAGVPMGEAVEPISPPRGLPWDFQCENDNHTVASLDIYPPWRKEYHKEGDTLEIWMGDHSWSCLTDDEMLAWYETAPTVTHFGVLDRAAYETWDKKTMPHEFCGGIVGPGIFVINDTEEDKRLYPDWTHIRCKWRAGLKEELAYFFNEVRRLKEQHGKVRFVFGFDS